MRPKWGFTLEMSGMMRLAKKLFIVGAISRTVFANRMTLAFVCLREFLMLRGSLECPL